MFPCCGVWASSGVSLRCAAAVDVRPGAGMCAMWSFRGGLETCYSAQALRTHEAESDSLCDFAIALACQTVIRNGRMPRDRA